MKLPSRFTLNLVFFVLGMTALVFLVRSVTLDKLLDQLCTFGAAFVLTFAVDLCSTISSTRGWYLVFQKKYRIPHQRLIMTSLASNSLGDTFSVGQGSELIKANLMRGLTPASEIASSLLLYNYLHVLVTSAVVFGAALYALFAAPLEFSVRLFVFVAAAVVLLLVFLLSFFLRRGACERVLLWFKQRPLRFLHAGPKTFEGARLADERMGRFVQESPSNVLATLFWLFCGRLFNLLEVFIILHVLDGGDSLPIVAAVFASTAMANYLLMFVPAREGFLVSTSYVIFGLLGLSQASGLSFEVIRRIRKMGFQVIGLFAMLLLAKVPAPLATTESTKSPEN